MDAIQAIQEMYVFVQEVREWSFVIMLLMVIIVGFIYFFPFIISVIRNHKNGVEIFLLNLFLGWTIIIWLIALIWACMKVDKKSNDNINAKIPDVKIKEPENFKINYVSSSKDNKAPDFHIELISDLEKTYKLYSNGIYNEEEYLIKKQNWIDLLKNYNFIKSKLEIDFLEKIIPLEQNKAINNDDLEQIKYIVSGKFHIDRDVEIQRRLNKEKEEKRLVKEQKQKDNKAKIITLKNNVIQDFTDKKEQLKSEVQKNIKKSKENRCSCGRLINEDAKFCRNCGKQLQ